jgi:hypothetical protein
MKNSGPLCISSNIWERNYGNHFCLFVYKGCSIKVCHVRRVWNLYFYYREEGFLAYVNMMDGGQYGLVQHILIIKITWRGVLNIIIMPPTRVYFFHPSICQSVRPSVCLRGAYVSLDTSCWNRVQGWLKIFSRSLPMTPFNGTALRPNKNLVCFL